jgi:hypothetical protein
VGKFGVPDNRGQLFEVPLNVECPEVEAWRARLVDTMQREARAIVARTSKRANLEASDPDLFDEMFKDAQEEVFDKLDEKPTSWRTLDELLVPKPEHLNDLFLDYVKHDVDMLNTLSETWVRPGTAIRLRDHGLIEWTRLVDAGLALRGEGIPLELLADLYFLAELNEALNPPKPFRRKAAARLVMTQELAVKLPDLKQTILLEADTKGDRSSTRSISLEPYPRKAHA